MLSPGNDSYLRYPTVLGDLVGCVAQDDVWLAPVEGGRPWQLTSDHAPCKDLRFSPDGEFLAYLSQRDGAPELHVVATAGGPSVRTTWWGDAHCRVLGWADPHRVLVASAVREPLRHRTWARAVPRDRGPASRLPYGPVTALDIAAGGGVVLGTGFGGRRRDYAMWKRYRGGTAGRLWIDLAGSGLFCCRHPPAAATAGGQHTIAVRSHPAGPGHQPTENGRNDDEVTATVDLDGLTERAVPIPVPAARYSSLLAPRGGLRCRPVAGAGAGDAVRRMAPDVRGVWAGDARQLLGSRHGW